MTATTLESSRSVFWPPSYATDQWGNLYIVNGLDRGDIWNGVDATSKNLGVDDPVNAPTITPAGGGGATAGSYVFYYRFKTGDGRYSNISTGTTATLANNEKPNWSNIDGSADARVTHVELLRSTSGQSITLYLVTTLTIGTTTYTNDTQTDAQISAGTAYPILNGDGTLNLNRFEPPPDKHSIASFYDRFFYAGDVVYDEGHAAVTNSSASVTGVGTAWTSRMVGRKMYFAGDTTEYTISAVGGATSITLTANFSGTTGLFTPYAIRAATSERNTIYYSRSLEPESVPATQTVRIQDDGDDITGLMPLRNFLYVLENRHLYRLSMATQGACVCVVVQYAASRGCINNHCWAVAEGIGYLMDYEGIHMFTDASQHISNPIQDLWRERKINFTSYKWFFASTDPAREIIRWHVCLGGDYLPQHAICYQWRQKVWWIEEFPWGMGGFALVNIGGALRPILGGQWTKWWKQDGSQDGPTARTIRGTCTAATALTLTDGSSDALIPDAGVVGAPVALVKGRGKGQHRRIVSVSSGVITVDRPWHVIPDTTSDYQIGAVPWRFKTGHYDFLENREQTRREFSVVFQPTADENSLDMRRYIDQADLPETFNDSQLMGDGVSTMQDNKENLGGEADAYIEMKRAQTKGECSGYRNIRLDGWLNSRNQQARYIALECRGYQGPNSIVISEIQATGIG